MADPRLANVDRQGVDPKKVRTYKIDNSDIVYSNVPGGSAVVGRAVLISGNGVVRLAGAGTAVHGLLVQVEPDGACTVQVGGVVDLPKGDGTIAAGAKIVGDVRTAARGYIRAVAAATLAEVAVASHFVNDASDADNVEVELCG
jgi:hypothetical protein